MANSADADPLRVAKALLASIATGLLVYWVVIKLALPRPAAQLAPYQVDALRGTSRHHPLPVLAATALIAAVLPLSVLMTFRLVYGPMRGVMLMGRR